MKAFTKTLTSFLAIVIVLSTFALFAIGSSEDDNSTTDQGTDNASKQENDNNIDDFSITIVSCRLTEDYSGLPVAIIKYSFTNNSDEPEAFYLAFDDKVYQDGIGLNECYFVKEGDLYSADNQTKEIKPGATLDVEVAYELNDSVTDLEVEVKGLFTFNDDIVKKTFSIK